MFGNDPRFENYDVVVTKLMVAFPKAPLSAATAYVTGRIITSSYCAMHVLNVISAQIDIGLLEFENGEIRLPENYPQQWIDAPIAGLFEIEMISQPLTEKDRLLLAQGLFIEEHSPWYIKYPSRIKRKFRVFLRQFF